MRQLTIYDESILVRWEENKRGGKNAIFSATLKAGEGRRGEEEVADEEAEGEVKAQGKRKKKSKRKQRKH